MTMEVGEWEVEAEIAEGVDEDADEEEDEDEVDDEEGGGVSRRVMIQPCSCSGEMRRRGRGGSG